MIIWVDCLSSIDLHLHINLLVLACLIIVVQPWQVETYVLLCIMHCTMQKWKSKWMASNYGIPKCIVRQVSSLKCQPVPNIKLEGPILYPFKYIMYCTSVTHYTAWKWQLEKKNHDLAPKFMAYATLHNTYWQHIERLEQCTIIHPWLAGSCTCTWLTACWAHDHTDP